MSRAALAALLVLAGCNAGGLLVLEDACDGSGGGDKDPSCAALDAGADVASDAP